MPIWGTPAMSKFLRANANVLLEASHVSVFYGRHQALVDASLEVSAGEIVVILGANGAGKSTLLSALSGMVTAQASANVAIGGINMTNAPAHELVEAGLALVPEGRGIFGELSVRENLLLGAFANRAREGTTARLAEIFQLFPRLQERQEQIVRTMSGGEQQMVAIGRALMSKPQVLMLDEPSLGLSPLLSKDVFRTLRKIAKTGVGVLVVEQNARLSLSVADRAYLLENGQISSSRAAAAMLDDVSIQQTYLGGSKATAPAASKALPVTPVVSPVLRAQLPSDVTATLNISVADLVQLATERSAASLSHRDRPTPAFTRAAAAADPPHESSVDVGASIESVVRHALERQRARATVAPSPAQPEHTLPSPPTIETPRVQIWRRPSVEIFRRNQAGKLVKD